jgi:hypothetical protein
VRHRFIALGLALVVVWSLVLPTPARAAGEFDSAYLFESVFLTNLIPGDSGTFAVFFTNEGAHSWVVGAPTQVNLAACRDDKVTCNVQPVTAAWNPGTWLSPTAYATQTKTDVIPGDFTSFTYQVKVPQNTPVGTYRFNGEVVLAATGEKLHPQGYFHEASVIAAGERAPSDVAANVSDLNNSGGQNDVRVTFTAPAQNSVNRYDLQRLDGGCTTPPGSPQFTTLTTLTVNAGAAGMFNDLDRPNNSYCYVVRVADPATNNFVYSNQVVATVAVPAAGPPYSTSAILARANTITPGSLFTTDSVDMIFSANMKIANASIRVADSDCGPPSSQAGPPAMCAIGNSWTTADIVCGSNANCFATLDGKGITVTLTSPPVVVTPGVTPGLQYPVTVIEVHGITDANDKPWDLPTSTDRVFGPQGQ